ncbi:hypothetical protein K3152_02345 [Qipengyuania sp. 1NDH17]|uniref:NIPSNAP domain-containing protein n=1 Tax=Qipengyuania polymorpha TaxID=2867234 RepID=A0ABS7IYD7_9SPHN|nr:hypothetical protein [Qipengyuania polymorpha]MBX7457075.1 hypothetical protein [Qipengyuania polymorpha]
MKKLVLTAAAATLGLGIAFTPTPVLADHHEAGEMEKLDQTWYRVNLVKFEAGNRKRIGEIIDMYEAANKASGVDSPVVIHMNTGPWDMMVFFRMKHGIESMGWKTNPEGEKWWAAFKEIAGGEEEANKIEAEWDSYVLREESHIAHRHPVEDE